MTPFDPETAPRRHQHPLHRQSRRARPRPPATFFLLVGFALAGPAPGLHADPPNAPPPSATPADRDDRWRADLAAFADQLPKNHLDFHRRCDKAAFARAVAELDKAIPTLPDPQIVLALSRLASMAGDAHTTVNWRGYTPPFPRCPINLDWFSDGLFITAADAAHADLIGARVVKIGDLDARAAAEAVRPFFAAENESSFLRTSACVLTYPDFLAAAHVTPDAEHLALTIAPAGAAEQTITLAPLDPAQRPNWIGPFAKNPAAVPLRMTRRGETYWRQRLPDQNALFIQYNACRSDKDNPFPAFAEATLNEIDEMRPRRVVIDLRQNGGGDSRIIWPLTMGLAKREFLTSPPAVYVLIGRGTFSSAEMNAAELRRAARAVLVGEPTGQKPNAFGEIRSFTLPNSGLQVFYSTKYFKTDPEDPPALMPDIDVRLSSGEYFAGKDPVLTATVSR